MRLVDVLMDSADDFSGDLVITTGTSQFLGRRRRRSFGCLPPRSLLFRWLSSAKKSKGQNIREVKSEEAEGESRKERFSGEVGWERKMEVGCSTNGLNGVPSPCVSELTGDGKTGEVSGQYRKEDCINLAVGFGLFYLIGASKDELNKMIELRTEMEMMLQNVKAEFQNQSREILSKSSKSNEIPAFSTIDSEQRLCSNGNISLQSLLAISPADTEASELCNQSLTCQATRQEKSKKVDDTAPEISISTSFGEVVDHPETSNAENFMVLPDELERRLHELLEARQEERIKELETALERANEKLCEKEKELWWWKDTARLISRHIPKIPHLLQ